MGDSTSYLMSGLAIVIAALAACALLNMRGRPGRARSFARASVFGSLVYPVLAVIVFTARASGAAHDPPSSSKAVALGLTIAETMNWGTLALPSLLVALVVWRSSNRCIQARSW